MRFPRSSWVAAARWGNSVAFEQLVLAHRREPFTHGYRMLPAAQDAEDALQESPLAAWRGMAGFDARSSLRTAGVTTTGAIVATYVRAAD
ncbi:MAG: sigma factor [Candidatus Dormibacter sp.]